MMAQEKNNLRSEQSVCSDEGRITLSDLRKFMDNIMYAIQEVNGRVKKLEHGMERLLIGTTSNVVEARTQSSGTRCLRLVFRNKISLPVLNGEEIKGEGGKYLEVALVDDVTDNVVDFGHQASAHVEIVALEGDFDHSEGENWVIGNYKNKVGKVSEDNTSVLGGEVKLKLNKGIGSLVNVKFRNSSCHNSGVFKLGAKVIDSFNGTLIKEAITEPFVVKDFRGKYKQKHYPPSLSDDVWRLENIQKGGAHHKRLKGKVKTVEDFLIQRLKNSEGLKCLLGLPETRWQATVRHAETCTINQKVYCSINSQEKKGVVFNVVGQILGLIKDWNYVHHEMLSQEDKVDARKLLPTAFGNKEGVKDFDDEASLRQYILQQSASASTNSPGPENTLSHEVEISKSGEFHQANTGASQDVLSSKSPRRASGLDAFDLQHILPSSSTTGITGLEAPVYEPTCIDQYNVNEVSLNAYLQDLLQSENLSEGTILQEAEGSVLNTYDLEDIFPPVNPGEDNGLKFPLFSPYNDDQENFDACYQDALLHWSPSKDGVSNELEASTHVIEGTGIKKFGSDGVQDIVMGSNCFINSHEHHRSLGPLWPDQNDVEAASGSLINNHNWLPQVLATQYLSSDADFTDCLKQKAALKGNRLQKKRKIS